MKKKLILPLVITLAWVAFVIVYWQYYSPILEEFADDMFLFNVSSHKLFESIGAEINYIWYRFGQIMFFAFITIIGSFYLAIKKE